MRRRLTHTSYFTALLLILTLTLSFIAVLPAKSPSATTNPDTARIVSMLELLRGNVTDLDNEAFGNTTSAKGRKTALENKISAVIHQVEAGALSGSLNKLQNDVNKTVTEWILPYSPQDADMLFEMILEIIELIKGIVLLSPEASFVFTPETPLAGNIVTFNASASEDPDGTIVSYTWDFGDNMNITESEDPVTTHNYTRYGIYMVSLTVTDNDNLTDTESKPITVIAPPTASFTYLPHNPLVNEYIIFNASDSTPNGGEIESYSWDFGDGKTTSLSVPITTHNYTTAGTYSVVLNVTDTEELWNTSTADITVYDFPPEIIGVFRVPEEPNYDEYVRILASVIDIEGEVESVILGYSINSIDWTNQTMAFNENIGFYNVEILPQPYSTNVSYRVYAYDKAGNSAVSDTYSYIVVDSYSPVISQVERSLISPNYNDTVSVTVSVSEPEKASGVQLVILSYSDGVTWTNITMALEMETIYEGSIPALPYSTIVEYMVYASDNAENWASSSSYFYTVDDKYSPTVEIEEPTEGSYLRGLVNITGSVQEDNLVEVELEINGIVVSSWQESGKRVFTWNTSSPDYTDGIYIIELSASDKAHNSAEKTVTVTVDNTLPTATVNAPSEEAFLRRTVIIEITGEDANLDKIELKINDLVIKAWSTGGTHNYLWNTGSYSDGTYRITLAVSDKAGNSKETSITTVVDNTPPIIDAPAWEPEEPSINEQVNITVRVSDIQPGSGIQNVTLWYRNTTMDDSQPILMSLNDTSGNWTATIPAQSTETTIEFYIEAFDIAGNKARKPLLSDETYEYKVIAPAGIPLAWIVAIILLILAATATAIYFWRKRRREKQGISSRA